MKFQSILRRTTTLVSLLCLLSFTAARAVIDDADAQYRERYGKPTHEVAIDSHHQGLIYVKRPYGVFVVFENGKSIGEMINKATDMSAVEIANILKVNSRGVAWRKENITKGKGDEEKMQAQGILDVQIWSRTDGKLFATYMHTNSGGNELHVLLIGNKQGIKLVSGMAQSNKQLQPKPIK